MRYPNEESKSILTPDALKFITILHKTFNGRRLELLKQRKVRQQQIDSGRMPTFLTQTQLIREDVTCIHF